MVSSEKTDFSEEATIMAQPRCIHLTAAQTEE